MIGEAIIEAGLCSEYSEFEDAASDLMARLRNGQVQLWGRRSGRGGQEAITDDQIGGMRLYLSCAEPADCPTWPSGRWRPHMGRPEADAPFWTDLHFKREDVLALWPDPLEEAHARAVPTTGFMSLHDALDWIAFRGLPAPEPPQDAREGRPEGDDSAPDRAPADESPTASPRVLGQVQGALTPAPPPEAARDADSDAAAGEDDEDWPAPRALTEAEAAWAAAWEEAEPRLVAELQRGEISALGKKRYGQMEQIPRGFWIHAPQPGRRSGGLTLLSVKGQALYEDEPERGEWSDIVFDRRDVLRRWPDPLGALSIVEASATRRADGATAGEMPRPTEQRDLRSRFSEAKVTKWYREWVTSHQQTGSTTTLDQDRQAARDKFGPGTRPLIDRLRREHAPRQWSRRGRKAKTPPN